MTKRLAPLTSSGNASGLGLPPLAASSLPSLAASSLAPHSAFERLLGQSETGRASSRLAADDIFLHELPHIDLPHIPTPKRMTEAELDHIGALLAIARPYDNSVNAMLSAPTSQREMADAIIRVRLSGSGPAVKPEALLSETDQISRAMYQTTDVMQKTHDPLNVATRVAILRGQASPLRKPTGPA